MFGILGGRDLTGKLLNTLISSLSPTKWEWWRILSGEIRPVRLLTGHSPSRSLPRSPVHQCNEQIMATRERCREKNWSHYVSRSVKRAAPLSVNSNPQLSAVLTTHQTQRALFPHVDLLIISLSLNHKVHYRKCQDSRALFCTSSARAQKREQWTQ